MTHVMVDIETLGTGPRAAVLTVAAVRFDEEMDLGYIYLRLDYATQLGRLRREADGSTLRFWAEQDTKVLREAFCDSPERLRAPLTADLAALSNFIRGRDNPRVWANSPSFDLVILESLLRDDGVTVPWSYRNTRDVRTLRALAGVPREWEPPGWLAGMAHNALADCRFQTALVRECWRRLGRSEP